MPIPGSNDDGTMTADLAQFDLLSEIAEAEQHKPWASGIHSRTLFKKPDFRVVLIQSGVPPALPGRQKKFDIFGSPPRDSVS